MASTSFAFSLFSIHFASLLVLVLATSDVLIEDGYTVTTVIDGHKIGINPHAVILKPGSSDLVVLDYSGSAFYTVPFPLAKDSVIKRLSGGEIGYVDGEPGSARFNKPRSFAVDLKGNVYVADKINNVIRKITNSGLTSTIAGVNKKTGRDDGPVQNATFSNDFELVFVPEICSLLVSDHGNQLVRQINLKSEDCGRDSGSNNLGTLTTSIWGVLVVAAVLVGFAGGFVARPYMCTHEGAKKETFSKTWKLCRTNLEKLVPILSFAIRSAAANLSLIYSLSERLVLASLSHISFVFRIDKLVVPREVSQNDRPSLIDSDGFGSISSTSSGSNSSSEMTVISDKYANQLKDLISFDGKSPYSIEPALTNKGCDFDTGEYFGDGRLDYMIKTNVVNFSGVSKETTGLVRRR